MRVVIVKHEEKLSPLIVSEEETINDLLDQWRKTTNTEGDFKLSIIGQFDGFIPETTLIKNLPLPSAGYSSIEVLVVRVNSFKISMADEVININLPLTCRISEVESEVCKALRSGKRKVRLSIGSTNLSDPEETLDSLGIQPGGTLSADTSIYLKINNLVDEEENSVELSAGARLKSLFDETVPKSDQRFYDHSGKHLNAEEPVIRSLGACVGVTSEQPLRILYVRRITVLVQPPPVSRDGFAEPAEQKVFVWPNKTVSCLLPRDKDMTDLAVWHEGRVLTPPTTFWSGGVRPFSLLFLDKKINVSVKKGESVAYKVELRRASRIRNLHEAVVDKEGCNHFEIFTDNKKLTASESTLLRHCGIKDGATIEIRFLRIGVVVHYEEKEYKLGQIPVFTAFKELLGKIEDIIGVQLPAISYFTCQCGRKISVDESSGQNALPFECCTQRPRHLTLHHLVDVKVTEMGSTQTKHLQISSTCCLRDVLDELGEFSGVRLLWNDAIQNQADSLMEFYINNRVEFQLERKIAVGLSIDKVVKIRWVWPSSTLGSLMQKLQSDNVIENERVMVMDGTGHLASYCKDKSPCMKKLTDYGIRDGTVVTIKRVAEEKFAEFTIIATKWGIKSFNISIPVPPARAAVYKAIEEKLENTRKKGCGPILLQVRSQDENGRSALFASANYWVNTAGKVIEPAFAPKFHPLDPLVLYIPDIPTKIHIRKWADGSE